MKNELGVVDWSRGTVDSKDADNPIQVIRFIAPIHRYIVTVALGVDTIVIDCSWRAYSV